MQIAKIKTLFLDIGGVLLTNGWDRDARKRSVIKFGLDHQDLEDRHRLVFSTYELGKISLDEYLYHLLFYRERNFSMEDFKQFMFEQSVPLGDAIDYFKSLKMEYSFTVVAVSNEARELNEYRISKYNLEELFDFFISSCYVQLRKPDPDIFNMACDTSHTPRENTLFIDDRLLYIEMAAKQGIPGHHFRDLETAKLYFGNFK